MEIIEILPGRVTRVFVSVPNVEDETINLAMLLAENEIGRQSSEVIWDADNLTVELHFT